MRPFILGILFVLPLVTANKVFGQWVEGSNVITFDAADSVLNRTVVIDTVHYPHNRWQIGMPHKPLFDSAYSWPNAIVTDTSFPYCPNDTSVFTIHFPWEIINSLGYPDIPMDLWFDYKMDTDASTRVVLEIWRGVDSTWIPLTWTTYDLVDLWKEGVVNLPISSLSNYDTVLRFTFIAGNDTMGKEGWLMDDINIIYSWPEGLGRVQTPDACITFPNPTHSKVCLESVYINGQVSIFNTVGNCVCRRGVGKGMQEFDLSNCADGMYFIEVENAETGELLTSRVLKN